MSEVFKEESLRAPPWQPGDRSCAVFHHGAAELSNAQPLVLSYIKGTLALAHNGNLVNADALRDRLAKTGAIFHTTTDSEVIAHCIVRERLHSETVEEAVQKAPV